MMACIYCGGILFPYQISSCLLFDTLLVRDRDDEFGQDEISPSSRKRYWPSLQGEPSEKQIEDNQRAQKAKSRIREPESRGRTRARTTSRLKAAESKRNNSRMGTLENNYGMTNAERENQNFS